MTGAIPRPANAVPCTCDKGWHLTWRAFARCHDRVDLDRPAPIQRAAVRRAVRR